MWTPMDPRRAMSLELEVVYAAPPGPPPSQQPQYAPPAGPPPPRTQLPALLPAAFPLLSPAQAHSLSMQGFTTFAVADRPALLEAATALFQASRTFFAQPPAQKAQYQVQIANAQGSEEGWSRVAGEKELITVRRGGSAVCPPAVEPAARTLWAECGALMQEAVAGVEQSLGMRPGALDGVVRAECVMPSAGAERLETLLRMFRYERRAADATAHAGKGRLVAEPHRDLGLLSLVIGASPGLEVWDAGAGAWLPIEEPPHAAAAAPGRITATLLVGETLTRLTNSRYAPGRHRVFVPPAVPSASEDPDAQFRYSLVFALRPHSEARVSTAALTTPITGEFAHPLEDVRARALFGAIARAHWNVNTGVKEREAQRIRLQGGGGGTAKNSGASIAKEKRRWSISAFGRILPGDGSSAPRSRWSVFRRVLRR